MKNKFIVKTTGVLFFLLLQLHSFGQAKAPYEKGIVELNNRQTVVGYIKNSGLAEMVSKIRFKHATSDDSFVIYDTSQIQRFWMGTNGVFELLRFLANNSSVPVSAFAKVLVRGEASLYKTAHKGEVLYVIKRDSALYVLQNDKFASGKSNAPVVEYHYKDRLREAVGKSFSSDLNPGKLAFSEKNFIDNVSAYNISVRSPNEVFLSEQKPVSGLLATFGGGLQHNSRKEVFLHTTLRTYFPQLSSNTSLNIGLNFYATKYSDLVRINFYDYKFKYTSLLLTLPVEVQHNLLNKTIRPFVSAGASFCYLNVKDQYGNSENPVFKSNVGVRPVYSGGVEADISRNILIKAAFRREVFTHLVLVGIGYTIL